MYYGYCLLFLLLIVLDAIPLFSELLRLVNVAAEYSLLAK